MSLEIERVESKKQLEEFIKVPWMVYKNDPNWVPWLFFERLEFFDKGKNPFFEHAEADYFIARRDGKPVGTIAAVVNHTHNEFHHENSALFGVFELLEDQEAADALLDAACQWALDKGMDKIFGPISLSVWDELGVLIDGYDSPPVILMPYNPPYYVDFLEAAGFTKAMDLLAYNNNTFERMSPGGLPDKLYRVINKVKDRYGLTIRPLNMDDFDNEIERVRTVINNAWVGNWGFVPMSKAQAEQLGEGLKPIIDPRIAFLVEKDGEVVGFSLSLPDVNQVLHKIRPGPGRIRSYIAAGRMLLPMMLKRSKINRIRVALLGVNEEYRARGVDALLYYETGKAAAANNYEWAELSWILESNEAINRPIELFESELYKRYRLYEKPLKPDIV
jgi:GNAT superfamily N-acetyltransferase